MSENDIKPGETPKSMLDRVARLIQSAEDFQRHGETGSAEAALSRADAIMTKYAIDRAIVESMKTGPQKREEPVSVTIPFMMPDVDFYDVHSGLLGTIAKHCRVRAVLKSWHAEAVLVGFPEDVEYVQMLWTSVHLTFVSKIDPTWDPNRPAEENIKILKEAGRKWAYIGLHANEHGFPNKPNDGRLKAAYRRQCKREGVEPTSHTQRHAAYRAAFASSFWNTISSRLWRMRQAAEDVVSATPGSEVALRDRMQDVNDAYYALFPHLRPPTEEERAAADKARDDALRAEMEKFRKMTPAQRAAYNRAQEREREREQARWERERAKVQDHAGQVAGASAARTVDLGGAKLDRDGARQVGS